MSSIPEENVKLIGNKMRRAQIKRKIQHDKAKTKRLNRKTRQKELSALGEEAESVRLKPKTLETLRTKDETTITEEDPEITNEQEMDEFSDILSGKVTPKICITTCQKTSKSIYDFIGDLLQLFPNSFFYERRRFQIKHIVEQAKAKGFTHLVVVHEDYKETMILLPNGPTCHFKLRNLVLSNDIEGAGRVTDHRPEIILNNFTTRLGHRVGRMLAAMFPHDPQFTGRRAVTFHNQLFMRHHRYMFNETGTDVDLQELGPQFTLKLKSLQIGTFDSKFGEFEWNYENSMENERRTFFL